MADGVAAVPNDGGNGRRGRKLEVAPERDDSEHADGQIGDADFKLKRAHGPADFLGGYSGKNTWPMNV